MGFVCYQGFFNLTTDVFADAITGRKTLAMSYSNYDIEIRNKYHVELTGWPNNVPFTSPSNITTSAPLRAARDALKSGVCRWTSLSHESREALAKRVDSGEITKKPRAPRADKGVKRGPRVGKENIPPKSTKKARNAVSRAVPPSAQFIDDADC